MKTKSEKIAELKKEIKAEEEIIKFIKLFGVENDINNIISPYDKKPVVTFEPKTREDYKRVFGLLKSSIHHDLIKKSGGCVGFKPVPSSEIIEDNENVTRLNYGVLIDTQSTKYENKIRIRFFLKFNKRFIDVWMSCPLEWFKSFFVFEEITDRHETETARQYNQRHAEIKTNVPKLNGFIEIVKFYGGHYTHYSVNRLQKDYLMEVLE